MNTKNMLYLAAAAGVGYYLYTNYYNVAAAPAPAAKPQGPQSAARMLELPSQQTDSAVPATAAATGDVKNAAAPNSTAETYYGVGGVEFKAQGLSKKHMQFGPIYGPSGKK